MRVNLAVLLVLLGSSLFVSVALFIPSADAWIPLEGHITQDTTLAVTTEPYRVVKDVIVDAGVTLTIEHGVTVEFADGLSLIVQGSLHAGGTESNQVYFTSSRANPDPGAWNTIRFNGGAMESYVLNYCSVSYAIDGLTVESLGSALIERSNFSRNSQSGTQINGDVNVVVTESIFSSNGNGILIKGSGVKVVNSSIHSNGNGIYSGYGVHNITLLNNSITLNSKGIYMGGVWGHVYDIKISENTISSNGQEGIYLWSQGYTTADYRSTIRDVELSRNKVTFNGYKGIFLRSDQLVSGIRVINNVISSNGIKSTTSNEGILIDAGDRYDNPGDINGVVFEKNKVLSNGGDGISLRSVSVTWPGPPPGMIYNVSFMNNILSSNNGHGAHIAAPGHHAEVPFDLKMSNNTVHSNNIGIYVSGKPKANFTFNSIYSNKIGTQWEGTRGNEAHQNDIYDNSEGMLVTGSATVNAEYNYWGDSTGPYHESLNPEGKGNPVNGDGTDLDFIPFSSSSFGPIVEPQSLIVDVSLVPTSIGSGGEISVSVHVTNGTVAVDDVLVQFASDKGGSFSPPSGNTDSNGDFDSTYTAPSVSEQTTVKITVTATKVGYNDGSDYEYVTIYSPGTLFLSVTVTADPSTVQSIGTSTITVQVTDGTNAVSDATVALSSNDGGNLSPIGGTTDANGYFTSTYTTPSVTTETTITITANATKMGYIDGQGQTQIIVKIHAEDSILWTYLIILIIILAAIIGIVAIARRTGRKPKEEVTSRR